VSKAIDFIWVLKVEGFRFALDDFGKGMSSFAYLKNLPVHYLKIYDDFVKDIFHDKISFGMVEAINRIGQMIGLETVTECAESEAILEKLKESWA
jgi:EAL domain-containing protein (putative c-di-GMP-specific phosphodiesterase class I)